MNKLVIVSLVALLMTGFGWRFYTSSHLPGAKTDTTSTEELSGSESTIIAFGDSLTAGYGVLQSEAYPAQLQIALVQAGYKVSVINAGVSGETTRGNLERADFIRAQNADIVIVGIGGNDALRALPIEETEKNILATIDILESGETPPQLLLLQMQAPLNAGISYKEQFDSLYRRIADERGLMLVPFLTDDIFLDTANKLPDGIHYNKQGYQKVVKQYIFPFAIKLLDTMENDE